MPKGIHYPTDQWMPRRVFSPASWRAESPRRDCPHALQVGNPGKHNPERIHQPMQALAPTRVRPAIPRARLGRREDALSSSANHPRLLIGLVCLGSLAVKETALA